MSVSSIPSNRPHYLPTAPVDPTESSTKDSTSVNEDAPNQINKPGSQTAKQKSAPTISGSPTGSSLGAPHPLAGPSLIIDSPTSSSKINR